MFLSKNCASYMFLVLEIAVGVLITNLLFKPKNLNKSKKNVPEQKNYCFFICKFNKQKRTNEII